MTTDLPQPDKDYCPVCKFLMPFKTSPQFCVCTVCGTVFSPDLKPTSEKDWVGKYRMATL